MNVLRKTQLHAASYKHQYIYPVKVIKIAKAYRTVSNEALCVITGLIPINIKIDETVMYCDYIKGNENQFDREMEVKYWTHQTKVVETTAAQEESKHTIKVYTDGSKSEKGVGSGIAIFKFIHEISLEKLNEM